MEKKEKPAKTAAREFWEESGYTISKDTIDKIQNSIHTNGPVIWSSLGKYALHLYYMNHDLDITERFKEITNKPEEVEMRSIEWVSLDAIEEAINNDTKVQLHHRSLIIYDLVSSLLLSNLPDPNGVNKTLLARLKEVQQQQNPNILYFT